MGYRYIGSKDKLSATLIDIIRDKCPAAKSVIDLMAGTGLFSLALRREGYRVIASDVMTYSYHHLIVNLKLNHAPKFQGLVEIVRPAENTYESVLEYLNQLQPESGFFTKEYSPDGRLRDSKGISILVVEDDTVTGGKVATTLPDLS